MALNQRQLLKKLNKESEKEQFIHFLCCMRAFLVEAATDGSDLDLVVKQWKNIFKGQKFHCFSVTRWHEYVKQVRGDM